MNFKTLAYAKLNLDFDHGLFANEYNRYLFPLTKPIANGIESISGTEVINKHWKMIPSELYNQSDVYVQPGDISTLTLVKRKYPAWQMFQLMEIVNPETEEQKKFAPFGGVGLRNESLDREFKLKAGTERLRIVKWIQENLPFEKIISIHCVSIEPGGFATIHRDMRQIYNNETSIGCNKVYESGFVIVNLNIANGGVPLYWSLDDATDYRLADDAVYLTNDYFYHGVPVCKEKRIQVRVTGIPKEEMWNLVDKDTIVDIGQNYQYNTKYPVNMKQDREGGISGVS